MIGAVTDKKRPIVESSLPSQARRSAHAHSRAAAPVRTACAFVMMTQSFLCIWTRVPSVEASIEPLLTPTIPHVREAAINADCVILALKEIN